MSEQGALIESKKTAVFLRVEATGNAQEHREVYSVNPPLSGHDTVCVTAHKSQRVVYVQGWDGGPGTYVHAPIRGFTEPAAALKQVGYVIVVR